MCNYYRKFQSRYSELTAKFQKRLTVKNKWTLGAQENGVFQEIKDKFLQAVRLHHPDFNKQFYLNCHASDISYTKRT